LANDGLLGSPPELFVEALEFELTDELRSSCCTVSLTNCCRVATSIVTVALEFGTELEFGAAKFETDGGVRFRVELEKERACAAGGCALVKFIEEGRSVKVIEEEGIVLLAAASE